MAIENFVKPLFIADVLPTRAERPILISCMKTQSRGHAMKVKCSFTSKHVRAQKQAEKAKIRHLLQKLKHVHFARAG
jgi:hypothetical protein